MSNRTIYTGIAVLLVIFWANAGRVICEYISN
jgi:hypothetical protein